MKLKEETRQLRESLNKSEAKVAQQKSVINYQREEIEEYKKKIKNHDEQLKKMEALVSKANNQVDQNDKENAELKNKIDELEKLLKQRYAFYTFEIYHFNNK